MATAKDPVEAQIAVIKTCMPKTYASIQERARLIGNEAFTLVRRALRGEPACFYAIEAGHVVGTPFTGHPIMDDVARSIVSFGCTYVCIWPEPVPAAPAG